MWRTGEDIDHTKFNNSKVIAQITSDQSVYATRAMKRDSMDKCSHLARIPRVYYKTYKTLTGAACQVYAPQRKIDNRDTSTFGSG